MGSIFGSFHTATVSLQQDQIALDATSNNISNQNTAGYAKRTVTWTNSDTVTLSGTVPPGSPVAAVSAQRSTVLDAAVVNAAAASSSASTVQTALNTLQSVFAVNSAGNEGSGINAAMSSFFSAMQSIAANPTSGSARQSALAAAQAVASSFQNTSSTLLQQTAGLNTTIQNAVSSVNQLTAAIAALNHGIANAPSTADCDTLLDQRTAQIQSLSQLVALQQTINSDGSVSLSTTSGGALVVDSMSNTVSTGTVAGVLQVYVQGSNITSGLEGGAIGGALTARDGAVAATQSSLDALATAFASVVNTANAAGTTPDGSAGAAVFSVSSTDPHAAATLSLVATGGDDFAAAGSGEGAGGTANANSMAALANQKNASGDTFADILSAVVSSIGMAASSAGTTATAASSALTRATTAQQNLSGVSLDTEAANLTQYQRSYQAEAKLISVLNQIMADIINMGSPTTVS